jgi:chromosome partitioning protein
MTQIIAVFNQAGGQGKTTMTLNLAYQCAQKGQRTLAIDLDSQGSLTDFAGLDSCAIPVEETTLPFIKGGDIVPRRCHGFDLIPATLELAGIEMELANDHLRGVRLQNAIAKIAEHYDVILLDCPPALGLLSIMALMSCSGVLIPLRTEAKGVLGAGLVFTSLSSLRDNYGITPKLLGFVPNALDKSAAHEREALDHIHANFAQAAPVFAALARSKELGQAVKRGQPLGAWRPKHPLNRIFSEIATALLEGEA